MLTIRTRLLATVPRLPASQKTFTLTATVGGELLAGSWNPERPDRAYVHRHDPATGWRWRRLSGLTTRPFRVDRLPGGGYVLAGSYRRGRSFAVAAQIFDRSGQPLRSFALGSGLGDLAVDEPGTLWARYIDEGVYGDDPFGIPGLLRVDEHGRRLWTYRPPPGRRHIDDCYILNVGARTAWAYYFADFPLVRITDSTVRAFHPTPVRGAHALAVRDDVVLFVGEYGSSSRLTEARLHGDRVVEHGPAEMVDEEGRPLSGFTVFRTRGNRLYLRTGRRLRVAEL
jgi:hypothetical protein